MKLIGKKHIKRPLDPHYALYIQTNSGHMYKVRVHQDAYDSEEVLEVTN